jgi:hypothetical protein
MKPPKSEIQLSAYLDVLVEAAAAQIALEQIAKEHAVDDAMLQSALRRAKEQVSKLPQVAALRSSQWASESELAMLRRILRFSPR